ncbi:hypothetical protein FO440_22555 [Mucilaginibacter corticis]|uniref:HTH luxR-type domain-containing protein n=1 Tax=Mucilaginibacter corticis TaxID=2597670 RepID=A0A556M9S0_9SPHI|nr:LuxR C-terminal-related transcriptional regulator [Mucilaginibacter corticis]TSJ36611.1 hypothetical protein FO440_22555 [Mucilaginibacter corticis]
MKLELFNNKINNVWKKMPLGQYESALPVELDFYKKLLNFFQVGDYYYYIFNFEILGFELMSDGIEGLLGFKPELANIDFFLELMHPEDRPYILAFEEKVANFLLGLPTDKLMKYKVRYDYRLRKANGNFVRILQQVAVIQHDNDGGILRTLGMHTDISHLKSSGKPVLSLIGLEGEPSYMDIDIRQNFLKVKDLLSKREREVLRHLIDGKLSKQISDIMHVTKQTVDSHRKNMLRKNNVSNTTELVAKAIKNGWV